MTNVSVAVVGCGATALSFLNRYLSQVEAGGSNPVTIYVFEKRDLFGTGAAYEPDLASNILNTKTAFITPFPEKVGDFANWLAANREKWQPSFPHFHAEPESYAPRALFGRYLIAQFQALVLRAASLNVQIVPLRAEVSDIDSMEAGSVITTSCGLSIRTDKVFLFCGTLSAKENANVQRKKVSRPQDPRICKTPYPITELVSKVNSEETIAIIGARLSAIDTVIALIEGGHKGKVRLYSRSGYFPAVRGTQGRITTQKLTPAGIEKLVAQKGPLEISDLSRLFQEELEVQDPEFSRKFMLLPMPPADIRTFLREEIEAAKGPRLWQAVLYATNGFIEQIWNALTPHAQSKLLTDYFSLFMAFRVSIPVENARKILSYIEDGKLDFVATETEEPIVSSEGIWLNGSGENYRHDRLVYAIGSPRNVAALESPLLEKLLKKGFITPHPLGGIKIDAETYRVLGSTSHRKPELYAVGELTVGQNFFTSALEINARHAYRCADALQKQEKIASVSHRSVASRLV